MRIFTDIKKNKIVLWITSEIHLDWITGILSYAFATYSFFSFALGHSPLHLKGLLSGKGEMLRMWVTSNGFLMTTLNSLEPILFYLNQISKSIVQISAHTCSHAPSSCEDFWNKYSITKHNLINFIKLTTIKESKNDLSLWIPSTYVSKVLCSQISRITTEFWAHFSDSWWNYSPISKISNEGKPTPQLLAP